MRTFPPVSRGCTFIERSGMLGVQGWDRTSQTTLAIWHGARRIRGGARAGARLQGALAGIPPRIETPHRRRQILCGLTAAIDRQAFTANDRITGTRGALEASSLACQKNVKRLSIVNFSSCTPFLPRRLVHRKNDPPTCREMGETSQGKARSPQPTTSDPRRISH